MKEILTKDRREIQKRELGSISLKIPKMTIYFDFKINKAKTKINNACNTITQINHTHKKEI